MHKWHCLPREIIHFHTNYRQLIHLGYPIGMARKKSKTSLPHTRAIQRDRHKRPSATPPDEEIAEWIKEVVHPTTLNQLGYFRQLGLRERTLSLPVMVAFMLTLLWRQVGSIREGVRILKEEGLLWVEPLINKITTQAVLTRINILPNDLFYRIMKEIWPTMNQRANERSRSLPPAVAYADQFFAQIWSIDGSVLDTVLKKNGLLIDQEGVTLAGKLMAIINIVTQVPVDLWYSEKSMASDQTFWDQILAVIPANTLLLFDKGLINYSVVDRLTELDAGFITRAKKNVSYQEVRTLSKTATVHDQIILLGSAPCRCQHEIRLVKVLFRGKWYCYLTNITDTQRLPAPCVVPLYDQRWRIEDAFNIVKRLLGLAYFYCGSVNAVKTQVWMTWLLYSMLIDLTDRVAERLQKPFKDISMEMVFRGLSHYPHVKQRGDAHDPVEYLADRAKSLGIIKQKRKKSHLSLVEQMNLTIPQIA